MARSFHPIRDLHDQALSDLESLMPAKTGLVWCGVHYPSTKSSLGVGSQIEWGGRVFDVKFALTVRAQAVAGAAQPFTTGKILTYDGLDYRLADVKLNAPEASYHLTLIDPNR